VEKLSQTVELIFRFIGTPCPPAMPRENKSMFRRPPSSDFLALIQRENQYDFRLHKLASDLLSQKVKDAMVPTR
jgi:hypothetical protein